MADDGSEKKAKKKNRPTKVTREGLISLVCGLIAHGLVGDKVAAALKAKYKMPRRTAYRYMALARKRLREEAGRAPSDLIAEAYAVYREIISRRDAKPSDIIRAQNSIDRLFGLRAPVKVEIAPPPTIEERRERVERVLQEIFAARQAAAQTPSEN